jgi:hypothetical protein
VARHFCDSLGTDHGDSQMVRPRCDNSHLPPLPIVHGNARVKWRASEPLGSVDFVGKREVTPCA